MYDSHSLVGWKCTFVWPVSSPLWINKRFIINNKLPIDLQLSKRAITYVSSKKNINFIDETVADLTTAWRHCTSQRIQSQFQILFWRPFCFPAFLTLLLRLLMLIGRLSSSLLNFFFLFKPGGKLDPLVFRPQTDDFITGCLWRHGRSGDFNSHPVLAFPQPAWRSRPWWRRGLCSSPGHCREGDKLQVHKRIHLKNYFVIWKYMSKPLYMLKFSFLAQPMWTCPPQ